MTSILKVNQIQDIGGNTIVSSDGSGGFTNNLPAGKSGSFRNIIINGDMSIAQRGTSATGLGNGDSGYNTVDRWRFTELGAPTYEFTQTQDTDVPTGQGFATSLKMDCTTAQGSLATGDVIQFNQRFEGQNLQFLKKGTANAESTTLSFWVKSNKTGTYIVELRDIDNSRTINKSYTIDSASTWEKKIIIFAGDTTGTFDNDNERSLDINFWLGAGTDYTSGTLQTSWDTEVNANRAVGQVNLADSTSNNFWITGIQLEAGTTASDFEFLPFDINKQRCFRYYELVADGVSLPITNAAALNTTKAYGIITFNTSKRTTPSLDQVSGTDIYRFYNNLGDDRFDDFDIAIITTERARISNGDNFAVTTGHAGWFETNDASCYVALDAEL